jgi:hypothetical protein
MAKKTNATKRKGKRRQRTRNAQIPLAKARQVFTRPAEIRQGNTVRVGHHAVLTELTSAKGVLQLNAGMLSAWLQQIAHAFDMYRFVKLQFSFRPLRSALENGSIAFGYEPNCFEDEQLEFINILQMGESVETTVRSKMMFNPLRRSKAKWLYVRNAAQAIDKSALSNYDLGLLKWATAGVDYAGVIGLLEMNAIIEFSHPQNLEGARILNSPGMLAYANASNPIYPGKYENVDGVYSTNSKGTPIVHTAYNTVKNLVDAFEKYGSTFLTPLAQVATGNTDTSLAFGFTGPPGKYTIESLLSFGSTADTTWNIAKNPLVDWEVNNGNTPGKGLVLDYLDTEYAGEAYAAMNGLTTPLPRSQRDRYIVNLDKGDVLTPVWGAAVDSQKFMSSIQEAASPIKELFTVKVAPADPDFSEAWPFTKIGLVPFLKGKQTTQGNHPTLYFDEPVTLAYFSGSMTESDIIMAVPSCLKITENAADNITFTATAEGIYRFYLSTWGTGLAQPTITTSAGVTYTSSVVVDTTEALSRADNVTMTKDGTITYVRNYTTSVACKFIVKYTELSLLEVD